MSIDVTIRQKMVRICASAAICGLSISFLIGEIVDTSAVMLRTWVPDPKLIPAEYSVLNPITKSIYLIDEEVWQQKLLAYNNDESKLLPLEASIAKSSHVPENSVHIEQAAERELSTEDVEKILISIHDATRSLADVRGAARNDLREVVLANTQKKSVVLNANVNLPQGRRNVASSEDNESVWSVSGKILTADSSKEKGHFEIGLYSKISPEGEPIGYPLVQQILPAGQIEFYLRVPERIKQGYLFAEFVSARGQLRSWIPAPVNPVVNGNKPVYAELTHRQEDTVSAVAASASADIIRIQGVVSTMFSRGDAIPQPDVVVKIRGRKEAVRTNHSGEFAIELANISGTIFLEFLKSGYHPMIIAVPAESKTGIKVELASKDAIDKIAANLGVRQSSSKGVFIGKAESLHGAPMKGVSAQLSLKSDGPYFFSEEGYPSTELRATSNDGRFLFLNVEAGAGFVDINANGEPLAPFQIAFVDGGQLISKSVVPVSGRIKGRLFNPVDSGGGLMQVSGARVRIEGASESSTTDSYGAFSLGPVKFVKDEALALEISAEKFYNHKFQMRVGPELFKRETHLYIFPANYMNKLASSMDVALDPYSGIVIGKISGPSVRVDALCDHANNNSARDFYFDRKGTLLGSYQMTDPRFGTYVIFNVPRGRAILNGNDSSGAMRYSESATISASTINVVMD